MTVNLIKFPLYRIYFSMGVDSHHSLGSKGEGNDSYYTVDTCSLSGSERCLYPGPIVKELQQQEVESTTFGLVGLNYED